MPRISTNGLTAAIRRELQNLHEATPRARTRRIDPIEAAGIAGDVRRLVSLATDDDASGYLTVRGGYVCNGYRYRAESDEVRVGLDFVTGTWCLGVRRTHAPRRRHGDGPRTVGRLATLRQRGRMVEL